MRAVAASSSSTSRISARPSRERAAAVMAPSRPACCAIRSATRPRSRCHQLAVRFAAGGAGLPSTSVTDAHLRLVTVLLPGREGRRGGRLPRVRVQRQRRGRRPRAAGAAAAPARGRRRGGAAAPPPAGRPAGWPAPGRRGRRRSPRPGRTARRRPRRLSGTRMRASRSPACSSPRIRGSRCASSLTRGRTTSSVSAAAAATARAGEPGYRRPQSASAGSSPAASSCGRLAAASAATQAAACSAPAGAVTRCVPPASSRACRHGRSASWPCRAAAASPASPESAGRPSHRPRSPPDGSASTSSRRVAVFHALARASAVVVTPGEDFTDASAISGTVPHPPAGIVARAICPAAFAAATCGMASAGHLKLHHRVPAAAGRRGGR